ncbi:MAG TPA: hypothetical protein VFQ22_12710, partial [Longimicrobiales bacterium]|nr:hypothetical protein [Longimicrobiales bacterium]
LRYAYPDGTELHYRASDGALRALELLEDGRVVQRVEITGMDGRWPTEAVYRNLGDFRELTLVRDSLAVVEPFDPEIFDPVG